jgi:uncharacterized protein YfaP (DUF2135 family)
MGFKKLMTAVIIAALAAAWLTGCSKAPSSTAVTSTSATVSTPVTTQSSLVQSGLLLSISQPMDAAVLTSTTITVIGKTVAGASVAVNEISGRADAQGNFSVPISLEEGPNALDVSASDGQGRTGETILMVVVDLSQSGTPTASNPTPGIFVKILQPLDGSSVKTGSILVSGQTASGALVVIGEVTADADANGNFSLTIQMAEGLNLIDVQAIGSDGSQAEDFILVQAAP